MFSPPIFRSQLLADPKKLGRWGERHCEKFLRKKGFKTVARNYSCSSGEIDLIFMDMHASTPAIVFVEVKTRTSETFAKAQDAVGHKKQKKMSYTAKRFVKDYQLKDKPLRFDVVAVILHEKGKPQIRHYRNAFVP